MTISRWDKSVLALKLLKLCNVSCPPMLVKKRKRKRWTNAQLFFPRKLIPDLLITNRVMKRRNSFTAGKAPTSTRGVFVSDMKLQMNNNTTGQRTKTGWLSAGSEIPSVQCQCHQPALTRTAALATPQRIKGLSVISQKNGRTIEARCLPNLHFLNERVLKLESALGTLNKSTFLANTHNKIRKQESNIIAFWNNYSTWTARQRREPP